MNRLPDSLSHSSFETLQTCPLKYKLSRLDMLERKGETGGRRRGRIFGEAIEANTVAYVDAEYEKRILAGVEQWYIDELVSEQIIVRTLVELYIERYGSLQIREVKFELPIGDSGLINRGYIDGVEGNTKGDYWIIEDKLLKMWTRGDEKALTMNGQVLRYLPAAKELYQVQPLGCFYRVTKMPSGRPRKLEKATDFGLRISADLRAKFDKDPDLIFLQFDLHWDMMSENIDAYANDLVDATKVLKFRVESDVFEGNYGSACKAYGGCEFLPACNGELGFEELYTKNGGK